MADEVAVSSVGEAADAEAADAVIAGLLPGLHADLGELVRIPSVSVAGKTDEALLEAHGTVARLFAEAGVQVSALDLPGTAPVVVGHLPAPPGAPTVLLYSHYDVAAAGDERDWDSPPFEAVERDGAIYGRGTADTKSNVMVHIGALRAWRGRPPVGIKLCIEGHEEVGSGALPDHLQRHPAAFSADALIIADMGNLEPGLPTFTTALRGMADVTIEVRTLEHAQHSGLYGGAAPDALLALLHAIASLHDDRGDVAVAGLRRDEWSGPGQAEERFRDLGAVLEGMPLLGTGELGSKVWSGPAITVVGIDVPSVDGAPYAVPPYARALLNMRVHPEQDALEAQSLVVQHLRDVRPFGIDIEVHPAPADDGFVATTTGPAYDAARTAWRRAWGTDVTYAGCGGSIPIVGVLADAMPSAEALLVGTADSCANIHGPNERVLIDELEKAVRAETRFFAEYAERFRSADGGGGISLRCPRASLPAPHRGLDAAYGP